jgi:hypothetical protein
LVSKARVLRDTQIQVFVLQLEVMQEMAGGLSSFEEDLMRFFVV